MTKSVNKFLFLLVALLICATLVFAACNKSEFKPVEIPASATPESNGGLAVVYGEWLYYVNGYTSDVSAENTYSDSVKDAPRIGSVVRIRTSELAGLFEINDNDELTSSEKTKKIASAVRGDEDGFKGAVTVIPKIYYSGNTATTQFAGIYIFNNRIYVTTPNDELTANGDPLTSQLVLMSFNMGGGDPKTHFTFTNNAAQIWLTEVEGKVVATYLMDSILHTLDVESGKDTIVSLADDSKSSIDNTVSGVNWDELNKSVFFIDKFGSLCKLTVGKTNYDVILKNETYLDHDDHIEAGSLTYTIKSVNNGIVFYTENDEDKDTVSGGTVLYWAKSATEKGVTLPTNSVDAYGWKEDKVIITKSIESGKKTFYSICIVDCATYAEQAILEYGENDSSIIINKIEGDRLYYTANSISYMIDLSKVQEGNLDKGTPRAKSLASTTGWAAPDFFTVGGVQYIMSANSDTVTLTKFNPEDLKSNPVSVTLTLTAAPEEE